MKRNRQAMAFHLPLHPSDTPSSTVGCRHTNPNICAKNDMSAICAFAREDNMCLAPPASWKKQYEKLRTEGNK